MDFMSGIVAIWMQEVFRERRSLLQWTEERREAGKREGEGSEQKMRFQNVLHELQRKSRNTRKRGASMILYGSF
jgi:hypothetical protein